MFSNSLTADWPLWPVPKALNNNCGLCKVHRKRRLRTSVSCLSILTKTRAPFWSTLSLHDKRHTELRPSMHACWCDCLTLNFPKVEIWKNRNAFYDWFATGNIVISVTLVLIYNKLLTKPRKDAGVRSFHRKSLRHRPEQRITPQAPYRITTRRVMLAGTTARLLIFWRWRQEKI